MLKPETYNNIYTTSKLIVSNRLSKFNIESKTKALCSKLIDNSCHFDNDQKINITPMLNKYNIDSPELLYHIYNHLDCKKRPNDPNTYIHYIFKERREVYDILKENKYNINKLYDIYLGIKFRESPDEPQIINITDFDGHHGKNATYEHLLGILNYKNVLTGYDSIYFEDTVKKIELICKSINRDKYDILKDTFIDNTTHLNGDTIVDLTVLCNKFNIPGYELFYHMYVNQRPFGMGAFNHKKDDMTLEKAEQLFKECNMENKYFDYYNGIGIKNRFRCNMNERQYIDRRRFDDRNEKSFYTCILSLIATKIF